MMGKTEVPPRFFVLQIYEHTKNDRVDRHSRCRHFTRTMWCGLMGVGPGSNGRFDIPYDADDFSRCYDLVIFAEISPVDDLPRICEIFPWYKPIVDSWDALVDSMKNRTTKVYVIFCRASKAMLCAYKDMWRNIRGGGRSRDNLFSVLICRMKNNSYICNAKELHT